MSCSILLAAFVGLLLTPLPCEAAGVVLEAGDPAPFGGVLIPQRELAGILAEKNRQREELQIRYEAELEETRLRLRATSREAALLREAVAGRDKALAALHARFEALKRRLNRWRFGLGLLILKSPEHVD